MVDDRGPGGVADLHECPQRDAVAIAVAHRDHGLAAGAHRLDADLLENPTSAGKQTKLGVNAHFGLDVYLTHALSLFGTGRFDLVQGARKSVQGKAYLGLRARF